MSRNAFLTALGAIAVLALALFFLTDRRHAPRVEPGDTQALVAAMDRIAAAQTELSQRMDRLEYRFGTSAGAPAQASAGYPGYAAAAAGAGGNEQKNLSPADRAALLAVSLHTLNDQLVRDPLSPQWAAANEKIIEDFLSKGNLSRQQLPAPKDFHAECHSHLCKISMSYPEEAQASQTESMLLMEIAPGLPNAQSLLLPKPDGSVELVVFAGDAQGFRQPGPGSN